MGGSNNTPKIPNYQNRILPQGSEKLAAEMAAQEAAAKKDAITDTFQKKADQTIEQAARKKLEQDSKKVVEIVKSEASDNNANKNSLRSTWKKFLNFLNKNQKSTNEGSNNSENSALGRIGGELDNATNTIQQAKDMENPLKKMLEGIVVGLGNALNSLFVKSDTITTAPTPTPTPTPTPIQQPPQQPPQQPSGRNGCIPCTIRDVKSLYGKRQDAYSCPSDDYRPYFAPLMNPPPGTYIIESCVCQHRSTPGRCPLLPNPSAHQ